MRVRARAAKAVAGAAGALAMAASLSGCITVHGETAVVPAASQSGAERAVQRYLDTMNEVSVSFDAEQVGPTMTGPLAEITEASLTALHGINPDGNPDPEAATVEFTRTEVFIPEQAGWPKFFVAEVTLSDDDGGAHWLLVFTRNSIDERWKAAYRAILPPDEVPELEVDDNGYLVDIPLDDGAAGLAVPPAELSTAYAGTLDGDGALNGDGYLQSGEGPFASGPYTDQLLAERETEPAPEEDWQYRDWAANEPEHAPVAMRTADGSALVFFTSHHSDRQTVAPGHTPSVSEEVEQLMEGEARTSVTRTWLSMQLALVPAEGEGDVEILRRHPGIIEARGE